MLTWAQVGAVLLAILSALVALFWFLAGSWLKRREKVEADLATAVESLKSTHIADIEGLRKVFFEEIGLMRELAHQRSNDYNVLLGKLTTNMDHLTQAVAAVQQDHKSLSEVVHTLDTSTKILADRMTRRRNDVQEAT